MRCSLLVLSSYIDSELDHQHTGEVEAHLVACNRCATALTYLREESDRIATLAPVHVDDVAAHELFALIGLPDDSADLGGRPWIDRPPQQPPEQPPEPEQVTVVPQPSVVPDMAASVAAWTPDVAMPDVAAPQTPAPQEEEATPDIAAHANEVLPDVAAHANDVLPQSFPLQYDEEPVALPWQSLRRAPTSMGLDPAAAIEMESAHVSEAIPSPEPPSPEPPEPEPPEPEEPVPAAIPAMPQRVAASGPAGVFSRMRDAVGVRWALMRGGHDDDAVHIVSGEGAPQWQGRPAHRGYQERMERRYATPAPVAFDAHEDAVAQPDELQEATGHAVLEPQRSEPVMAGAGAVPRGQPGSLLERMQRNQTPPPQITRPDVPAGSDHIDIPLEPDEPRRSTAPPMQPPAGRHMRTLNRANGNGSRFASLGGFTSAVARRTGAKRGPGMAVSSMDRRLWIFGAGVAALMLIGVLVGRSTTPIAQQPVVAPQPTAASTPAPINVNPASAAPSAAPTTAPTSAPTAAPTPTPAPAAGLPALANIIKLGNGGTGYTVSDIRYGHHGANDYRLVFDLNGGNGAPNVEMGFGTPTTFYVVFSGASPNGQPAQPNGIATHVKLLEPSPEPGKTIYEFTLTKNVDYVANYISGPRLVIDLK